METTVAHPIPPPNASNCFIVGCARNCARYITPVFENIRQISSLFRDTRVIISYDISQDNTLDILRAEEARTPNMEILTHTNPLSSIRTERIANARNRLIQRMKALYRKGWDYFIVLDLDDVCSTPINVENIRKYLGRTDWDALSWNREEYYDIWALSYSPYVVSCWNWGEHSCNIVDFMRQDIQLRLGKCGEDELFVCHSAFNGIALYRTVKFLDCEYVWKTMSFEHLPRDDLVTSIKTFHIYPKYTNVYDDCEHREFHRQAVVKNGAKIRISPLCVFRGNVGWG